jgi:hypothetical protein
VSTLRDGVKARYAFENFHKINHRTGSLGLNLACNRLLLAMQAEGSERFPQHHCAYWASEILTHRVTFILVIFFHRAMRTEVLSWLWHRRPQVAEVPANYYVRGAWDSDGTGGSVNDEGPIGIKGHWTKVS